jgi:hypothetical protein
MIDSLMLAAIWEAAGRSRSSEKDASEPELRDFKLNALLYLLTKINQHFGDRRLMGQAI